VPDLHTAIRVAAALAFWVSAPRAGEALVVEASPPVRVTLSVYDQGFALVNELRRVTLARGENTVRFRHLPSGVDPATVSFIPLRGEAKLTVWEQQYGYDLAHVRRLMARYAGERVSVRAAGEVHEGTLLATGGAGEEDRVAPFTLQLEGGALVTFPSLEQVDEVTFPEAAAKAFVEPTLVWRLESAEEGPKNLRLSYKAEPLEWGAAYECLLKEGAASDAFLAGRAVIRNGSDGRYENARVKLVVTEGGRLPPLFPGRSSAERETERPGLRYTYGSHALQFEKLTAGSAVLHTYTLQRPLTLEAGETKHAELFTAHDIDLRRFYVYDGVRFERHQRPRRNNWDYGTEFDRTVDAHIEFENTADAGLGSDWPPGQFRLYEQDREGMVDLIGEEAFAGVKAGETGHVRLGPARGLEGAREQTGYVEVTPMHQYEESFEIRLMNHSEDEVEIRVVEHLYRWPEYEIVRADSEFTETGPQTIEFRPLVKPGGKRSIHYTVRYSW